MFYSEIRKACTAEQSNTSIKKKKLSMGKQFFPVSWYQQSREGPDHPLKNCYYLLNKNTSVADAEDVIDRRECPHYLGFFGDRDSMQKILDLEGKVLF